MAAVLYWRLPELAPTKPGPLPWLPGIPETLRSHPGWGPYLTKRSQLVADLAAQVQDHAYQSDGPPAWAAPGNHPSTALVGDIAVWRAANGINPQDLRTTGDSARNASGPVETTSRPGYRACHQPARRCEGRQATRRTHRPPSKGRQAAPVPTTRTASQRAVRARPIAQLSRQSRCSEHEVALRAVAGQAADRTGSSCLVPGNH